MSTDENKKLETEKSGTGEVKKEATISAAVQKILDENKKEISDLKKENQTLEKTVEANATEIKELKEKLVDFEKLQKEHVRSGNLLTSAANKETELHQKYDDLKSEFEVYKEDYKLQTEEEAQATIAKRQDNQKLMSSREAIKTLTTNYMKSLEEALK